MVSQLPDVSPPTTSERGEGIGAMRQSSAPMKLTVPTSDSPPMFGRLALAAESGAARGQEGQAGGVEEDLVVRDEIEFAGNCCRSDPPVGVVNLLSERVAA